MNQPLRIGNARCLDPASGLDVRGGAIIENDVIADVGPHLAEPDRRHAWIDAKGLIVAPGLIDLNMRTGEPGSEHRETLASAARAAAAGGVTSAVVMPDTDPVIDNVALFTFMSQRATDTACIRMHPAASLTVGMAGKAMTEIGLLREAGVRMFTGGHGAIADTGLLARAMRYGAAVDALIALRPDTPSVTSGADVNAGAYAERLGLSGAPAYAEWAGLARDLLVAENAQARLLVDQVSTARSLDMIDAARTHNAQVVCTVAAHHLHFNELDVGDYLTHRKVWPPLRSEEDRGALVVALAEGRIDAIVSAHHPCPAEEKRLPFAEAAAGAVGLETLLTSLTTLAANDHLPLSAALAAVTCRPADILGLPQGRLAPGAPADLVIFDPHTPWVCRGDDLLSRSRNTPFDGRRLFGRAEMTICRGQIVFSRGKLMCAPK